MPLSISSEIWVQRCSQKNVTVEGEEVLTSFGIGEDIGVDGDSNSADPTSAWGAPLAAISSPGCSVTVPSPTSTSLCAHGLAGHEATCSTTALCSQRFRSSSPSIVTSSSSLAHETLGERRSGARRSGASESSALREALLLAPLSALGTHGLFGIICVPRHVARPLAPPRESARVPGPTSSAWRGRSSELYPCE